MRRVTLTQFLIEQQRAGRINPELRLLIEVVARAVKAISVNVSKGALAGVLGEAGTDNVQGEADAHCGRSQFPRCDPYCPTTHLCS